LFKKLQAFWLPALAGEEAAGVPAAAVDDEAVAVAATFAGDDAAAGVVTAGSCWPFRPVAEAAEVDTAGAEVEVALVPGLLPVLVALALAGRDEALAVAVGRPVVVAAEAVSETEAEAEVLAEAVPDTEAVTDAETLAGAVAIADAVAGTSPMTLFPPAGFPSAVTVK